MNHRPLPVSAGTAVCLVCSLATAAHGIEPVVLLAQDQAIASLEEDLRLGALDGAEHEVFGRIALVIPFPDGSFAAVDRQAIRIHVYDAYGAHVRTFGAKGEGPGEFQDIGGAAILADGSIAIHDPRTRRVSIFSPGGDYLRSHPAPGGFFGPLNLLHSAVAGGYLLRVNVRSPGALPGEFTPALVRFGEREDLPQGDTIFVPIPTQDPSTQLVARLRGRTSLAAVPFTPQGMWDWHPTGYWITGTGVEYQIFVIDERGDTIRVIERESDPVPVVAEEREELRDEITASMVTVEPGWKWTGAEIPDHKPFFADINVTADGRIWILKHGIAERRELDREAEPRRVRRWVAPTAYDVFEVDGQYLGEVRPPQGFRLLAAYGQHVWSHGSTAIGVPQLVRYRINFPSRDP